MNHLKSSPFNIRVYGIFCLDHKCLVSDELIFGKKITKFPGGGLHFGEGPADCIRREMLEETGQSFEVIDHFYTTDFFQLSAFRTDQQVISIYYRVHTLPPFQFRISDKIFDFSEQTEGAQSFRWVPMTEMQDDIFTLPIDRFAGDLLKKDFQKLASKT